MNASELLANLNQQGIKLWAENDKINIRSPKGVVTPEIQAELAFHKADILALLRETDVATKRASVPLRQGLSLHTIGRLIGGFTGQSTEVYKPPIIDFKIMAKNLKVTFRPLPNNYKNIAIIKFRDELEAMLNSCGVETLPWQQATAEFSYEIILPIINWKKSFKFRGVRAEINAVIDVDRPLSLIRKLGAFIAENIYQFYSRFVLKNREISVIRIAKLSCWAEDYTAKYVEDPTNTQVIIITDIDKNFVNPLVPYQKKIDIGLKTLIRTFSEIVIGVSNDNISILNMNLSDSMFHRKEMKHFVSNSLIPKVFVPIAPLLLSRFEQGQYNPHVSIYANKLITLSSSLASTGLFPPGYKLSEVIKRKSHRDIVNVIVNGRTGVSYGFVAYAEPPQYVGKPEILYNEWENLSSVEGFSSDELRQNQEGRRYVKTYIGGEYVFKQVPDIWLVSSRSGSNKTNLNIASDIIRIGLKDKLLLELPQGAQAEVVDIKPSYDIYVMLAIALSAALYAPRLIQNGAPIVHFHGYPAFEWFKPNEHCAGVHNPSVPCGTYESGIFNFLGISNLVNQDLNNIALAALVEPDHGTNIIANDLDYLLEKLKAGCVEGKIELGGKHFASLKAKFGK